MAFLTEAAAFFSRVPHRIAWGADPKLALQTPGPAIETDAIRQACAKRRCEFRSGRNLARGVLAELGRPVIALPSGPDRRPQWPEGIHGSITHCDDMAVVAAARGLAGIGVDVEPARPLPSEVSRLIVTGADDDLSPPGARHWPTRVFCAKEAFYKAVSHRLPFVPDFDEAAICPLGPEGFRVIPLSARLHNIGLVEQVLGWHVQAGNHLLALALLPTAERGHTRFQNTGPVI